jgi:hypothetical protein
MFPISVEFTAETRGHTLNQNQDIELEFMIHEQDSEGRCSVCLFGVYVEYDTFMAEEDSKEHDHYNGTS